MNWNPLHIYSKFKKRSQEKKEMASWMLLRTELKSLEVSLKHCMFAAGYELCWHVCVEPSSQIPFAFITQDNFCFYSTAMSAGRSGLGLKWSALPPDVAHYLTNSPVKTVELEDEVYLTLLEFDQMRLNYTIASSFSVLKWLKTVLESLLTKAQGQQRAKLDEAAEKARQKSAEWEQISQRVGDVLLRMQAQEAQHV